ncbi:hypothetical protein PINS_up013216 [Pythium insidiosum]|nr:hypothetical protein PINS_up013216 [Pythium insidiosum]
MFALAQRYAVPSTNNSVSTGTSDLEDDVDVPLDSARDRTLVLSGSTTAKCGVVYDTHIRLHLRTDGSVLGESLENSTYLCSLRGQWRGANVEYTLHYRDSMFVYRGRLSSTRLVGRWEHADPNRRNQVN